MRTYFCIDPLTDTLATYDSCREYSVSYFDLTVYQNFVRSHFIAPLQVRQPADDALLKHAGRLCEHVRGRGSTNMILCINRVSWHVGLAIIVVSTLDLLQLSPAMLRYVRHF